MIGEYVYDDEGGRHQAFYSPIRDVVVLGETIRANERIQVEQSLKYSQAAATRLWSLAGMTTEDRWTMGEEYGELTTTSELYHCPTRAHPSGGCFFPLKAAVVRKDDVPPRFWNNTTSHGPFLSRNDPLTYLNHVIPAYACVC